MLTLVKQHGKKNALGASQGGRQRRVTWRLDRTLHFGHYTPRISSSLGSCISLPRPSPALPPWCEQRLQHLSSEQPRFSWGKGRQGSCRAAGKPHEHEAAPAVTPASRRGSTLRQRCTGTLGQEQLQQQALNPASLLGGNCERCAEISPGLSGEGCQLRSEDISPARNTPPPRPQPLLSARCGETL